MHVVFSSDSSVDRSGYYAKIHTLEVHTTTTAKPTTSGCAYPGYKGDNYCDDENNNANCDYDGGDCCGDNVDTSYCTQCLCLDPGNSTISTTTVPTSTTTVATITKIPMEPMLCPNYASIGNGICDQANDNLVCYFDGGDCSLVGDTTNCTSLECVDNLKFDPCPRFDKIGNDQCDKENLNLICSFDAGDCQAG